MAESFKNTSRFITAVAGLITLLSLVTVDVWQTILPSKYVVFAPMIVSILAFLAAQLSEEKRIRHAEELVHEQYAEPVIEEEDIIESNDSC